MGPDWPAADWQTLTEILLTGLGDQVAVQGHPTWVMVRPDPEAAEGFTLCLSDADNALEAQGAPPDCLAVGMVATGRVRALDDPGAGPTGGIRMACLVTRDGTVAWRLVQPDGTVLADPPQAGQMLDYLRSFLSDPQPLQGARAGTPARRRCR
jgi:hypothetical protein